MGKLMVAKESYATEVDGVPYSVRAFESRVDSDHPLVKMNPQSWEEIAANIGVEQATAAPEEARAAPPRAAKTTTKPTTKPTTTKKTTK